jgi:transcriptional regulator with XRE-family HTH domain
MKGYRTRRDIPHAPYESAEYVKAGEHIALGQAVYDQRIALGLSQAELASRAGTTRAVISRVEGGSVDLTLPLLHQLAGALRGEPDLKITGSAPADSVVVPSP